MDESLKKESILDKLEGASGNIHLQFGLWNQGLEDETQAMFIHVEGAAHQPAKLQYIPDERSKKIMQVELAFERVVEGKPRPDKRTVIAYRSGPESWTIRESGDRIINAENTPSYKTEWGGEWRVTQADIGYSDPERFIRKGSSEIQR
jgi:hypothetical protein